MPDRHGCPLRQLSNGLSVTDGGTLRLRGTNLQDIGQVAVMAHSRETLEISDRCSIMSCASIGNVASEHAVWQSMVMIGFCTKHYTGMGVAVPHLLSLSFTRNPTMAKTFITLTFQTTNNFQPKI
jgi:hypothetical protein